MRFISCVALLTTLVCAAPALAQSADGSAAPDVTGRYAHYDVVAYDDPQPWGGSMRSLVITYGFTDLSLVNGQLIESETFCHAAQKSNLPVTSTVDDSFTRAIQPPTTPASLTLVSGQWTLHRPETPTGIGIRLEHPATEALPTDPNDPRIADDDHDGHPGVTVHIKLGPIDGELYLARREIFAYDMALGADGRFAGVVRDRSEQLTVGGQPSFLIAQHHPVQDRDLSKSPIVLTRLQGDYDCDRLMAEKAQIFPAEPQVSP